MTSARDKAVIEALETLEDGVLDSEKAGAGIQLLSKRLSVRDEYQRNQLENKSSEHDAPDSSNQIQQCLSSSESLKLDSEVLHPNVTMPKLLE